MPLAARLHHVIYVLGSRPCEEHRLFIYVLRLGYVIRTANESQSPHPYIGFPSWFQSQTSSRPSAPSVKSLYAAGALPCLRTSWPLNCQLMSVMGSRCRRSDRTSVFAICHRSAISKVVKLCSSAASQCIGGPYGLPCMGKLHLVYGCQKPSYYCGSLALQHKWQRHPWMAAPLYVS